VLVLVVDHVGLVESRVILMFLIDWISLKHARVEGVSMIMQA